MYALRTSLLLLVGVCYTTSVPVPYENASPYYATSDYSHQESDFNNNRRRAEDVGMLSLSPPSSSSSSAAGISPSSIVNYNVLNDEVHHMQERADEMVDVLRALNLPEDFADLSNDASSSAGSKSMDASPSESSNSGTRVSRQEGGYGGGGGYMTGNDMLDKIMNCPCQKEQLESMGVKGVEYDNQPSPDIYRDPPYSPNAHGPGDVIAGNLKSVGGTTGNVFGQLIRLVLGLPNLALSLLKPLVVGAADTLAQTTDAAAGVTQQAAKSIPVTVRSGAIVLKKLLETVGDVTGGLLHVLSNLMASLAAAKTSISGTLPFVFDIVGDVSGRFTNTVGTAVDWVAGTKEILTSGVVQAAKTKNNLFGGIVEGTKGFGTGLLEGIKYGVNDEPQPAEPGWKKR